MKKCDRGTLDDKEGGALRIRGPLRIRGGALRIRGGALRIRGGLEDKGRGLEDKGGP